MKGILVGSGRGCADGLGWGRCGSRHLEARGDVSTQIIDNPRNPSLMPIILSEIEPDRIASSDRSRSYHALTISAFKHDRINHLVVFTEGGNHRNGFEHFWSQTTRVLCKYHDMPAKHLSGFLKESEWGLNFGSPHHQGITLKKWCGL